MESKYKVLSLVIVLLVILSFSVSYVNYQVSYSSIEKNLRDKSLPLSLDNIYNDIEKHIIKPHIISSAMANNSFLKNWLKEESDIEAIKEYLSSVKNNYKFFNTFVVSEKTKNYYSKEGLLEVLKPTFPLNRWYFDFKESSKNHEVNLDLNTLLSNNLIMFINYKIFDENSNFLGVTGVALEISYINELLKTFRTKHNFVVTFYNKSGQIVLSERLTGGPRNIKDKEGLSTYQNEILSKESKIIEYKKDNDPYILNSKYIPELDLYLTVEAKLSDFTKNVKSTLYFNILLSSFITLLVAFLVYFIIARYSKKLEFLSHYDFLTKISNRRHFEERLKYHFELMQRKEYEVSILFLDIDNFKVLNDTLGHGNGDKVLKRISKILKNEIRKIDLLTRWGGEEFIIALIDSSLEDAIKTAEKLRVLVETDLELKQIKNNITISLGISRLDLSEGIDSAISKADKAMYLSKKNGKNQISVL